MAQVGGFFGALSEGSSRPLLFHCLDIGSPGMVGEARFAWAVVGSSTKEGPAQKVAGFISAKTERLGAHLSGTLARQRTLLAKPKRSARNRNYRYG